MPARKTRTALTAVVSLVLMMAACAPAAPASPTAAPAKPAAATIAPTTAPAKPAASPAAVSPSPSAVASPSAAAKPASTPAPAAAKPVSTLTLTAQERAEAEAFYKGKTVKILVGFGPGGGYDTVARTTGKSLSKFLPGNPTVIVENMAGASSIVMANNLYRVAPKDGTVIGIFDSALILVQAVGAGGGRIEFDSKGVTWLGSPTSNTNQCMVTTSSGHDSMEKIMASTKPVVFGATGLGNSTSILPSLMKLLGANIQIVTGYDGVAAISLAVERGEADGVCGTWESFRPSRGHWVEGNPPFARVVVKGRPDPAGDLKDVPEMRQFLKTDEQRQILDLAMATQTVGHVFSAPPNIPPLQAKALRVALAETWNSTDFQDDVKKAQLAAIVVQSHEEIQRMFDQITGTPPQTLERAKDILGIQ